MSGEITTVEVVVPYRGADSLDITIKKLLGL